LIRGSEVLAQEAKERYARDLEYELTHYLEEDIKNAPNKRSRQVAFEQARNNALLWIKGAIHKIMNTRLTRRSRFSSSQAA
jgi:hypothetical protein